MIVHKSNFYKKKVGELIFFTIFRASLRQKTKNFMNLGNLFQVIPAFNLSFYWQGFFSCFIFGNIAIMHCA
jgi:hypothetical protein